MQWLSSPPCAQLPGGKGIGGSIFGVALALAGNDVIKGLRRFSGLKYRRRDGNLRRRMALGSGFGDRAEVE